MRQEGPLSKTGNENEFKKREGEEELVLQRSVQSINALNFTADRLHLLLQMHPQFLFHGPWDYRTSVRWRELF